MKLISKSDGGKRVRSASSVAEAVLKQPADVAKLLTELKEQTPCVLLVCVK